MKFFVVCLLLPALVAGGRIVGGGDADNGEWPWQLSLRNLGSHSCGASLIRPNWAVCAAHCVGSSPSAYTIIAGTNQRSCPGNNCEERRANSATRHEDFQNIGLLGFPNDISIIHWVDAIAESSGSIQYVPLATTADQVGRNCYITGWGRLYGNGPIPENLQEAHIDLLTTAECSTMWSPTPVTDSQVCVFDKATQARGACNGDSGGPLVCELSSGSWELVGATSWGRSGCSTDYPSVYTRVSAFNSWILNQIGE
uniref:Acrosin n=1 Tax=Enchytraeus japonensis TaxID=228735 RepID=H1A7B2_9ANNE|nr:serine proteinase [Enchytraeus japonensis]